MIEKGICYGRRENRRDHHGGRAVGAHGRIKADAPDGADHDDTEEIDTIRQAGISPIVVVTGYQADVLERHISHRGAVCIETSGMRHRRCTAQSAWDCAISRKKPIGCCCSLPTCR
ncbi:MAG: hypothetical protein ACLR8P_21860 [Clostridium fessum]